MGPFLPFGKPIREIQWKPSKLVELLVLDSQPGWMTAPVTVGLPMKICITGDRLEQQTTIGLGGVNPFLNHVCIQFKMMTTSIGKFPM